jgi:glycosyltransferase involved in cell wall biosynthesis
VDKLEKQFIPEKFDFEVIFVDNDPFKHAEATVAELQKKSKLKIIYAHESRRSISHARNRSIKEANGAFIVFIDDDEFPTDTWLMELHSAIVKYDADGVLGPVEAYYDEASPIWLKKSGLLNRERFATGNKIINPKYTRTGNVIFKRDIFDNLEAPFDPKYGIIGGGDVEFFERMLAINKKFVWCDSAIVYELIEEKRRKKLYYIKRAFTRGLTNSIKYSFFRFGTLKSIFAIPIYIVILPFASLFGQHYYIKYSVKLCDHLGKILGYLRVKIVKERPY